MNFLDVALRGISVQISAKNNFLENTVSFKFDFGERHFKHLASTYELSQLKYDGTFENFICEKAVAELCAESEVVE